MRLGGTILLIALLALAACVSAERVPVLHAVCLPMKEYTLAQQQKAAAELAKLPKDAELPIMMTDYGQMRAGDRECLKHADKA